MVLVLVVVVVVEVMVVVLVVVVVWNRCKAMRNHQGKWKVISDINLSLLETNGQQTGTIKLYFFQS